jgi:hypothetical protein
MPIDDNWDWPFLYYVGTVLLKMTPAIFWKTKPKKLKVLTDMHILFNSGNGNDKNEKGYIDNVI